MKKCRHVLLFKALFRSLPIGSGHVSVLIVFFNAPYHVLHSDQLHNCIQYLLKWSESQSRKKPIIMGHYPFSSCQRAVALMNINAVQTLCYKLNDWSVAERQPMGWDVSCKATFSESQRVCLSILFSHFYRHAGQRFS